MTTQQVQQSSPRINPEILEWANHVLKTMYSIKDVGDKKQFFNTWKEATDFEAMSTQRVLRLLNPVCKFLYGRATFLEHLEQESQRKTQGNFLFITPEWYRFETPELLEDDESKCINLSNDLLARACASLQHEFSETETLFFNYTLHLLQTAIGGEYNRILDALSEAGVYHYFIGIASTGSVEQEVLSFGSQRMQGSQEPIVFTEHLSRDGLDDHKPSKKLFFRDALKIVGTTVTHNTFAQWCAQQKRNIDRAQKTYHIGELLRDVLDYKEIRLLFVLFEELNRDYSSSEEAVQEYRVKIWGNTELLNNIQQILQKITDAIGITINLEEEILAYRTAVSEWHAFFGQAYDGGKGFRSEGDVDINVDVLREFEVFKFREKEIANTSPLKVTAEIAQWFNSVVYYTLVHKTDAYDMRKLYEHIEQLYYTAVGVRMIQRLNNSLQSKTTSSSIIEYIENLSKGEVKAYNINELFIVVDYSPPEATEPIETTTELDKVISSILEEKTITLSAIQKLENIKRLTENALFSLEDGYSNEVIIFYNYVTAYLLEHKNDSNRRNEVIEVINDSQYKYLFYALVGRLNHTLQFELLEKGENAIPLQFLSSNGPVGTEHATLSELVPTNVQIDGSEVTAASILQHIQLEYGDEIFENLFAQFGDGIVDINGSQEIYHTAKIIQEVLEPHELELLQLCAYKLFSNTNPEPSREYSNVYSYICSKVNIAQKLREIYEKITEQTMLVFDFDRLNPTNVEFQPPYVESMRLLYEEDSEIKERTFEEVMIKYIKAELEKATTEAYQEIEREQQTEFTLS